MEMQKVHSFVKHTICEIVKSILLLANCHAVIDHAYNFPRLYLVLFDNCIGLQTSG